MEDKPSVLPRNIHSQYLRYKANTKLFLNWLHGEAKKLMNPNLLPREATALCTQHLLPMAQACKLAAVAMPQVQRSYLEQAINLRRKVGKYYASADSQSAVVTDDGHRFFTNCLDRILDLFPAPPSAKDPLSPPSSAPAPDSSFTNKFGILNVEDYEDTGTEYPQPKPAAPSTPSAPTAKEKLFDLIEDSGLELICLLNDIRQIRLYVQEIWASYQARKLDLISAALITEAAFECIGIMDENFGQLHPELYLMPAIVDTIVRGHTAGWPDHLHLHLFKDAPYIRDDSIPDDQSKFRPYVDDPDINSLSDWLMAPAFNMMIGLAQEASCPVMRSVWPDDADYQMLRELEMHAFHSIVVGEENGVWRNDRLMLYLWKPQNEGIHLTTVALSTIMLDLRKMDGLFAMVTEDYDLFSRKFPHDWYEIDEADTEFTKRNKRRLAPLMCWLKPEENFDAKDCIKINPVKAGLTLFMPYQRVMDAMVNTTSRNWSLMPMAHVYNYARVLKSWPLEWRDMEKLIAMQSHEIFSADAGRPTDIRTCENRFWLAHGGTSQELTALRKNPKTTLFETIKNGKFPRQMSGNPDKWQKVLTREEYERIKGNKNSKGFRHEFAPTPILTEVYNHYHVVDERFGLNVGKTPQNIKSLVNKCLKDMGKPVRKELTVIQFLEGFAAVAQVEVPHMFFDFEGMDQTCLQVLQDIHERHNGWLPERTCGFDIKLFANAFFDHGDRKKAEFMVKSLSSTGDKIVRTNVTREWEKFCKKAALFPRSEYGFDEKYKHAILDRMSTSKYF